MPNVEYAQRYGNNHHFKRIVIKNDKGQIIKIVVKIEKGDVLDALDFVD